MTFKITPEISKLIKLQRTHLKDENVGLQFWESCYNDFEQIKGYIKPGDCILDIGCGLAGTDLIIKQNIPEVDIYLFDLDQIDKVVKYGYAPVTSAYNLQKVTATLFELNGVDMPPYFTSFPEGLKFNIVLSFLSYGFHYPIHVYIDKIIEVLEPEGTVILDIRKDKGQEQDMRFFLGQQTIISDTKSYRRIAFQELRRT